MLPSFVCPNCLTSRLHESSLSADEPLLLPHKPTSWLVCPDCKKYYPVFGNIYVLWPDEIKELYADSEFRSNNVKSANIFVYQQIASRYKEHHSSSSDYSKYIKLYLDLISSNLVTESGQSSILDIGCSSGELLDLASAYGFSTTLGADISFNNLLLFHGTNHIGILCDAESLPIAPSSIDAVTCIATLHHIPNAFSLFKSVSNILKPHSPFLVGGEPTQDALSTSFISRIIWNLRKPVYRLLSIIFNNKFILHSDRQFQDINDIAENQRSAGGFTKQGIVDFSQSLPLTFHSHIYGLGRLTELPSAKSLALMLSGFKNPFKSSNWKTLSILFVKS